MTGAFAPVIFDKEGREKICHGCLHLRFLRVLDCVLGVLFQQRNIFL